MGKMHPDTWGKSTLILTSFPPFFPLWWFSVTDEYPLRGVTAVFVALFELARALGEPPPRCGGRAKTTWESWESYGWQYSSRDEPDTQQRLTRFVLAAWVALSGSVRCIQWSRVKESESSTCSGLRPVARSHIAVCRSALQQVLSVRCQTASHVVRSSGR